MLAVADQSHGWVLLFCRKQKVMDSLCTMGCVCGVAVVLVLSRGGKGVSKCKLEGNPHRNTERGWLQTSLLI